MNQTIKDALRLAKSPRKPVRFHHTVARKGYQAGGHPEEAVEDKASETVWQQPQAPAPVTQPDDAHQEAFLKEQLKGSAPQYDPAAGVHTAKEAGLMAAGMIPGTGLAAAAGKFPTAEGGFEPSLKEDISAGHYGSAALKGLGASGDVLQAVPGVGTVAGELLKMPLAAKLAIFAGPKSTTADLKAMENAEKMLKEGTGNDTVWEKTGWFAGKDGKLRYRIDDDASKISELAKEKLRDSGEVDGLLGSIFEHIKLFEAYPHLKNFEASLQHRPDRSVPSARFVPGTEQIAVMSPYVENNPQSLHSILLHELQHAVQDHEGFAPGTTIRKGIAYDPEYWKAAGENEARRTQFTHETPTSEMKEPPWAPVDAPKGLDPAERVYPENEQLLPEESKK